MTEQAIRTGVVGLGAFGRHHVRHLAGQAPHVLAGVCDMDADLRRTTAAAHGCAAFDSPEAMIGHVDAVSVAAPATVHHAIVAPLLDAGIHVLVEKPLATNMVDGRDLIARARRTGATLHVGHVERFSPAMMGLKDMARQTRRIACVRRSPWTGRSADVDVVLDMMIHDIDHVLQLAGSHVASVAASGRSHRSEHIDEAEAWLTFANGAIATLSASRVSESAERRIIVTEPDRILAADLSGPILTAEDRTTGERISVDLPDNDNLGDEIAAFLAGIGGNSPASADGSSGLAALGIALQIQATMADEVDEIEVEFIES